jgi:hypothetical protein
MSAGWIHCDRYRVYRGETHETRGLASIYLVATPHSCEGAVPTRRRKCYVGLRRLLARS